MHARFLPYLLAARAGAADGRRARGQAGEGGHATHDAVLQQHVVLRGQAHAGAEDVDQGLALLEEGIDDGRARRHHGRLEHVGEEGEDGVEAVALLLARLARRLLATHRDALAHLADEHQVQHQRRRQQRVLARVVHGNGVGAVHEDAGRVLVHGALAVAHCGHVLDDHHVVRVLALRVQDAVGLHHVVHDVGLGDLLAAELLRRGQVLAVVVAQVVVADDGGRLDAGGDEEVYQHGLHLGLARLEVVAADVHAVARRQLHGAGHEGVLGRAVDVGAALQDGGHGEDGGGGHLRLGAVDGGEQVVRRVVQAGHQLGEALRVGGPEDDHLVQAVGRLELLDVSADGGQVGALVSAGQHVVGALALVGGDEVGVVDGGQGLEGIHALVQLALQVVVQHLCAAHGVAEGHAGDVPAAQHQVVGVHHGQQGREGDVDVTAAGGAQAHGGCLGDGADVVRALLARLRVPRDAVLVCQDAGRQRRAVVAAPAHDHDARPRHLALRGEHEALGDGRGDDAAALNRHGRRLVRVLRRDGFGAAHEQREEEKTGRR